MAVRKGNGVAAGLAKLWDPAFRKITVRPRGEVVNTKSYQSKQERVKTKKKERKDQTGEKSGIFSCFGRLHSAVRGRAGKAK